jgi:hypothetical protein
MKHKILCLLSVIFVVFFVASCDDKKESSKYSGDTSAQVKVTESPLPQANEVHIKQKDSSQEPLPNNNDQLKSITIDGSLDDWSATKPSAVDELNDAKNNGADIECVYAAQDPTNLYIAVVVRGINPAINFILNTDNKLKGDYTYNYSSSENAIYAFKFESEDKGSACGKLDSFAVGDGVVELMIPLSAIGNPEKQRIQVLSNTDKPDYLTCDQLKDWLEVPTYRGNLASAAVIAGSETQKDGNEKQYNQDKKGTEKTEASNGRQSQDTGGESIVIPEETLTDDTGDGTIRKGQYVYFGQYYGEPILWECVKKDGNSVMLVSKHIICLKAFDAAECGKYDGEGDPAQKFGSNIWKNSNIREWLNSDKETVKYTTQAPVKEALWEGHNEYAQEAGFLTNFSEAERKLLKPVNHEGVEDKVFLLSEQEVRGIWPKASLRVKKLTPGAIANSSYNYKLSGYDAWFWLTRTPTNIIEGWKSTCHVRIVMHDLNGEIGAISDNHTCRGNNGIAPALYLSSDAFISGKGTADDPYIVTN